MRNTKLFMSETIPLIDTYTGESLARHAEIREPTVSELEKMIEIETGFKLKKHYEAYATHHQFFYEIPEESNPAVLTLAEDCYVKPQLTIDIKIENPSNIEQAYNNVIKIFESAVRSLDSLGKVQK
jgi:hypothetical protein